jgi:hypothetical protein
MLPNNARIYDLNYNATISATLLVRHYDGKEKASLKSTRSTSLPSRSCCILYLCASRPITQNADSLSANVRTTKADISWRTEGKIVVSNELVITNRAIVRHTRKIRYSYKVAIRTIKDEGGFPRSLALMVHASTGEIMVKGNVSQSINSETSSCSL